MDSRLYGSSPAASAPVNSRLRGNDDSRVIPAEAGIQTALTEHQCGAASVSEPDPEFDVRTVPVPEGWGENTPPAIGEEAIDTGDRVADGGGDRRGRQP